MAVALGDAGIAIDFRDLAARPQYRVIGAEPHRAAKVAAGFANLELIALHPFGHGADDGLHRGTEFSRTRIGDAAEAARRLDAGHLHAETDAEIRYLAGAREGRRL